MCGECQQPVGYTAAKRHLSPESNNKLEQLLLKRMEKELREEGKSDEQVINCTRCDYPGFVSREEFMQMKIFKCQTCEHEYCPHCYEKPHPPMSCQEYKMSLNGSMNDQVLGQMVANGELKKCPHCNSFVFRT